MAGEQTTIIGFFIERGKAMLVCRSRSKNTDEVFVYSLPGLGIVSKTNLQVKGEKNLSSIKRVRMVVLDDGEYLLTYSQGQDFCIAKNITGVYEWKKIGQVRDVFHGLIAPFKIRGRYVAFCGNKTVQVASSEDLVDWELEPGFVLGARHGYFDAKGILPIGVSKTDEGIFLLYFSKFTHTLGCALFDGENPNKLIWRSANPIWTMKDEVFPLAGKVVDNILTFYYIKNDGEVYDLSFNVRKVLDKEHPVPFLERSTSNPILEPNPEQEWESQYTFNTAIVHEDGQFHFVYRAIGDDGVSVLGYANSSDGLKIERRSKTPIFSVNSEDKSLNTAVRHNVFSSGGSWGGCEDPRLTKLDGRIYMTYTQLSPHGGYPRVAIASIDQNDFSNQKWSSWSKPVIISPPGELHKNWVLFPKKVKGKYALMHSITPDVRIEYLDDLDFENRGHVSSQYIPEYRDGVWDNRVRGVGAPPIETDAGWLVFYHAVQKTDPGKYKLGAMILDKDDPEKELYRSVGPVLEPSTDYEHTGFKPGIIYNCGAVVVNDLIYVYYGAADSVVCLATTNLSKFVDDLKHHRPTKIDTIFSISLIS